MFVTQIAYLSPITNPMNNVDNVWELGLGGGGMVENVEL